MVVDCKSCDPSGVHTVFDNFLWVKGYRDRGDTSRLRGDGKASFANHLTVYPSGTSSFVLRSILKMTANASQVGLWVRQSDSIRLFQVTHTMAH